MVLPALKIPTNPYKLSTTADPLGIQGADIPGVGKGFINLGPSPYQAPDAPTIMSAFVSSLEPTRQTGYENIQNIMEQRGAVGSGAEFKAYGKYDQQLGQDVLNKYGELYGQGEQYNRDQYNWETSKLESMYNTIYKEKELDPTATTADKNIALWLKSKLTGAPYTPINAATGKPTETPYNATTMEPIVPVATTPTTGTTTGTPVAPVAPTPVTPPKINKTPEGFYTNYADMPAEDGNILQNPDGKIYVKEGGELKQLKDKDAALDYQQVKLVASKVKTPEFQTATENTIFNINGKEYAKSKGELVPIDHNTAVALTIEKTLPTLSKQKKVIDWIVRNAARNPDNAEFKELEDLESKVLNDDNTIDLAYANLAPRFMELFNKWSEYKDATEIVGPKQIEALNAWALKYYTPKAKVKMS